MRESNDYHTKRQQFYRNIDGFWADLYGEEYALYDIKLLKEEEVTRIRQISERIGTIFLKVLPCFEMCPMKHYSKWASQRKRSPF